MHGHRSFQRFDDLAGLLHFLEQLDHLFPLAQPRSQLTRCPPLGLDSQRRNQLLPVFFERATVLVEQAQIMFYFRATSPMPFDGNLKLGFSRDAIGLSSQAIRQRIGMLHTLQIRLRKRAGRSKFSQKGRDFLAIG